MADMTKGTTKSGFEFEIDSNVLDNMELVDALAEASEDATQISKAIRMILGDEQRKKLYEHVRNEDGVVSVTAISDELLDMFDIIGEEAKN